MYDLYLLPTKAVDYKLLTNIKKEDLLGWFLTYQNFRLCLSLTDFNKIAQRIWSLFGHCSAIGSWEFCNRTGFHSTSKWMAPLSTLIPFG